MILEIGNPRVAQVGKISSHMYILKYVLFAGSEKNISALFFILLFKNK